MQATAYVAVKKPLLNDLEPYIFKTTDFGKSWTKITSGIGPLDYVHVVREDRKRRGLLFAGTQHGVYVSHNDGAQLAVAVAEPAGRSDFGYLGRGQCDRDLDARAQLLRPRRSGDTAAGA